MRDCLDIIFHFEGFDDYCEKHAHPARLGEHFTFWNTKIDVEVEEISEDGTEAWVREFCR